ncbi:MAG: hypothetical protein CVV58_06565, partial [Tenericutes bacterium HGW-Tenericutes-3]
NIAPFVWGGFMDNKRFGKLMLQKRRQAQKSILDVSRDTGINSKMLTKYENGGPSYDKRHIEVLSAYYDIDTSKLHIAMLRGKDYKFHLFFSRRDEDYKMFAPKMKASFSIFKKGFKHKELEENNKTLQSLLFSPTDLINHNPYYYLRFLAITAAIIGIALVNQDIVVSNILMSIFFPMLVLILLFELHYPRTLKGIQILAYFVIGGLLSITTVYAIRVVTGYPSTFLYSDLLTGFIEELSKILIVFLILSRMKVKHVITGILVGFAVGAGFDAFETSAYGLGELFYEDSSLLMMHSLILGRGFDALIGIGHHYWTGMLAGTLIYVSKAETVHIKDFLHPVFIFMFVVVASIHASWNFFTVNGAWWMWVSIIPISLILFIRMFYISYVTSKVDICKTIRDKQGVNQKAEPKEIIYDSWSEY